MSRLLQFAKVGRFHKVSGNTAYGWAFVSTVKGLPYFDLGDGEHSDHIPADSIEPVASMFMQASRVGLDMHSGTQKAEVLYAYPMIDEIMRGNEIASDKQGLMIGWTSDDKELLAKVTSGERTGFSIGGIVDAWDIVDESGNVIESVTSTAKRFGPTAIAKYAGEIGKQKRRIFRSWKLAEISLVDFPMQEPALVGVVKSKGKLRVLKTLARATSKAAVWSSVDSGHQHTIDPACCETDGSGRTSYETAEGESYGHDHAWLRDPSTGEITIGMNEGHAHTVEASANPEAPIHGDAIVLAMRAAVAGVGNLPPVASAPTVKTMPTANEKDARDAQIETLTKSVETWKRIASLTDAQRAYHKRLDEVDAAAFLAKSSVERDGVMKMALDADPVRYTAKSGRVFRDSESELADMAKALDASHELTAKRELERDDAVFGKVATTKMAHLTGDAKLHVRMLKALRKGLVDDKGVPDDKAYDAALNVIAAADATNAEGFVPEGTNADGDATLDDPATGVTKDEGKSNKARLDLDKMAKELANKDSIPKEVAKARLLRNNAAAKELYAKAQTWDRKHRSQHVH